jgi:hypothetical protein
MVSELGLPMARASAGNGRMDMGAKTAPESVAGVATAEEGFVMLDGPDGVAIAMTAEAAELTGQSLIAAAAEARQQGESEAKQN